MPAVPEANWANRDARIAVLLSGGVDSAILLAEALHRGAHVWPLYIACGMYWERAERAALRRFLRAVACDRLAPLVPLRVPVRDLLGDHWSMTGRGVPDGATPDEAVYLPGRNVLLLGKAMIWCHLHSVPVLALAALRGNPFPDATDGFIAAYQGAVNAAIDGAVRIERPYKHLSKRDVMLRNRSLPLELTFSCIQPRGRLHCGQCNKCAERRAAFEHAGLADLTIYADLGTSL